MNVPPRTVKPAKELDDSEAAQTEFLEDIRVSLQEMKDGKVLPADDALNLLELGLTDDELDSRLPQ